MTSSPPGKFKGIAVEAEKKPVRIGF